MKKVLVVDDQLGWRNFNSGVVYEILGKDVILDMAENAQEGYSKLLENKNAPYDYVLTDMQMETDYLPLMAGEWLIEQLQTISSFYKTKVIIISASPNIKHIVEKYNVFYLPKRIASTSLEAYKELIS